MTELSKLNVGRIRSANTVLDEQLMRETLKVLETEARRAHRWDNSGHCYGQRPICPSVHCAEARAAIAKLEERLLRE